MFLSLYTGYGTQVHSDTSILACAGEGDDGGLFSGCEDWTVLGIASLVSNPLNVMGKGRKQSRKHVERSIVV